MPQIDSSNRGNNNLMHTTFIGIDPGKSGGLSFIRCGDASVFMHKMPETEEDIWNLVGSFIPPYNMPFYACLEKVGGYVGKMNNPGSAMFNFGWNYGLLRMALVGHKIPLVENVQPRKWQAAFQIAPRKKDESDSKWKNRLRARAQQLFPQSEIILQVADSVLIAEYCRRKMQGLLK